MTSTQQGDGPRRWRQRADERGSVTAETAVLLPSLLLVALALAWIVSLGVAQVQCIDAARDAARALARAESEQTAVALARQTAPTGAQVRLGTAGGMVEVEVTYRATPPGGLLDGVAAFEMGGVARTPVEGEHVG